MPADYYLFHFLIKIEVRNFVDAFHRIKWIRDITFKMKYYL